MSYDHDSDDRGFTRRLAICAAVALVIGAIILAVA
jgi:hypothetical protein